MRRSPSGYRLPARHVIHTVGPVWRGGDANEPALLASCYRRSLEIADAQSLETIAFPSISTGVFGYPAQPAARIAIATARRVRTTRVETARSRILLLLRDGSRDLPGASELMIDGDSLPTIDAPRVRLRWLTARDIDALFAIFSDRRMMRYWSTPAMKERAEAEAYLTRIHEGFVSKSAFQWGVERKDDGQVLGTCTLFHIDARNLRAELGYALASAYWSQGYMREALTALIGFSFGDAQAPPARGRRRSAQREFATDTGQARFPARGPVARTLECRGRDSGHGLPRPAGKGMA